MAVAAALALGALLLLAHAAGWHAVARVAARADWIWLAPAVGAQFVAFVGYAVAYRELVQVDGGPTLRPSRALALVVSGFGVFIPGGGFVADYRILVARGVDESEARMRVFGLGALEYALLAPAAAAAAIVALVRGGPVPRSFTLPWAIAVPLGFAAAAALVERRDVWHRRGGVLGLAAGGLDVIALLRALVTQRRVAAAVGMAAYWAADIAALAACLRAFATTPPLDALVLGYATGYALTRRTLPLAGAGAVEALLPLALVWVKVALAPALLAVAAYRIVNLWLPVVPALAGRRLIRRDAARPIERSGR